MQDRLLEREGGGILKGAVLASAWVWHYIIAFSVERVLGIDNVIHRKAIECPFIDIHGCAQAYIPKN